MSRADLSVPQRRLDNVLRALTTSAQRTSLGKLTIGDISTEVLATRSPSRLPLLKTPLSLSDPFNLAHLRWMLQKSLLGQDIFLIGAPGVYARRLVMTFCQIINREYEHVALHRDVGEGDLKQGREIRQGGNLEYVDSATIRAIKEGRILILEGVEKAERGILPILNNILENREVNLESGKSIVSAAQYAQLADSAPANFIPAHPSFIVVAIGAPVPPYSGFPLDPPFRSRFQVRHLDNLGASLALARQSSETDGRHASPDASWIWDRIRDVAVAIQLNSESGYHLQGLGGGPSVPNFPQTALANLSRLLGTFPPSSSGIGPDDLSRILLTIHPALVTINDDAWVRLAEQVEEAELGKIGERTAESNDGGLLGYHVTRIERVGETTARVRFEASGGRAVEMEVPAGPKELIPLHAVVTGNSGPPVAGAPLMTSRFRHMLTSLLQLHALGSDVALLPSALPSAASTSASLIIDCFASLLGYEVSTIHLYKEIGGRELLMRRRVDENGATCWEDSPLIRSAKEGTLAHMSGVDALGPTFGSLARLMQDRESELWEGQRLVARPLAPDAEPDDGAALLSHAHTSFRVLFTASKSQPLKEWLNEETVNCALALPGIPLSVAEETELLTRTGASDLAVKKLMDFARRYREMVAGDQQGAQQRVKRLGTRSLLRIAKRLARFPDEEPEIYTILVRTLLADFLPPTERTNLDQVLDAAGIRAGQEFLYSSPEVADGKVVFPVSSGGSTTLDEVSIPKFDASSDPVGAATLIPHSAYFSHNSQQSGLMRAIATDLELLGEHLVLLGNQGVGKNRIVDQYLELAKRPREYIQLHRDTTVSQLMFTTTLDEGIIRYHDSPLIHAVRFGRVLMVDEADKAPEHVVAIFRSLAERGEMTLADGRRIQRVAEGPNDIAVHPNFRMILLGNRPGFPFLGNHFLQVLGDGFSCHSVGNPDKQSETILLSQLAPELDEDLVRKLVWVFQDLRAGFEDGSLTYPFSLRELINLVRHLRAYPNDSLDVALRNIFDFDIHRQETIDFVYKVLKKHRLQVERLGIEAVRESTKDTVQVKEIDFEPKGSTDLNEPRFGKKDDKEHHGGNTWAGGTGGRDTVGLGGRGGYMRLFKGKDIYQVSDELKKDVPDHIRERAREMAKRELAQKLEELNLSSGEASTYSLYFNAVSSHIAQLHALLENLQAKEEERIWLKRQADGELDDQRLTDGLTGEATIYKRRASEKPEMGRPQLKPKRIRFIFDISASMYRFQGDGRLDRSLECAVMIMEAFARLTRPEKYVWDVYGHCGDSPEIPLIEEGNVPMNATERWKVIQKMVLTTQYSFAGDHTVLGIEKAVDKVGSVDSDEAIVICVTDANFARYGISADELKQAMNRNPKVRTALIAIGEGAEAEWLPKALPQKAYQVKKSQDIPVVLRSILSHILS